MRNKLMRYEPLDMFALAVGVSAAVAVLTSRQWRAENEIEVGPVSIPLFTALFFVSLLTALRSPRQALRAMTRLMPTIYGGIYTGAAFGLALLGMVSTAVSGGSSFGFLFFASFLVWPVLVAAVANRTRQPEYYACAVLGVAAVGVFMDFGLRVFPDNINLVGMMVSSAALYLMVRTTNEGWVLAALALLAALAVLAILVVDSRRTLGLAHAIGIMVLFSDRFFRRKPEVSRVAAAAAAVCALCLLALASSFGWVESLPGGSYLGSIADFFSDEQRRDTDGRRAQLMGFGIDAIRSQPWVGVGGGRYLDHLDASGVEESLQVRPHNLPIFIWAELGLMGFVLVVMLLAAPIVRFSRQSKIWVVLLPSTLSMFTNDYYFSPGYFAALLLVVVAHREEGQCVPSTSPSSWSSRTEPGTSPELSIQSVEHLETIDVDLRSS